MDSHVLCRESKEGKELENFLMICLFVSVKSNVLTYVSCIIVRINSVKDGVCTSEHCERTYMTWSKIFGRVDTRRRVTLTTEKSAYQTLVGVRTSGGSPP